MNPSDSPGNQLRLLRNLLRNETLMNQLLTEESLNELSASPQNGSSSTAASNHENHISIDPNISNGSTEADFAAKNDAGIPKHQDRLASHQHQADDLLHKRHPTEALTAQQGHEHSTHSIHKPQHASPSNLNSPRNGIHKKGTAKVVPVARVAKSNKPHSRPKSASIAKTASKAKASQIQTAVAQNRDGLYSQQSDSPSSLRRFVVGLDFGTTTTAVSYYAHPVDDPSPRVFPDDVKSTMNWPNDDTNGYMSGLMKQVPTQSWYSPFQKSRKPFLGRFDSSGFDVSLHENSDNSDDEDDEEEYDYIDEGEDGDEDYIESPPSKLSTLNLMQFEAGLPHDSNGSELEISESDEFGHYLWGYEVPNARYLENITRDPDLRLERMKSMLVKPRYLSDDKLALRARLDFLIDKKLIRKYGKEGVPIPRDVQDPISDFLTQVLKHTGQQLTIHEDLTADCPITFVATVPVIWSPLSSRVLQYAMEEAIKNSGFGTTLGNGSIDNLYITTEPQAAATYLLAASRKNILPGDTIVVLDCGGGTVDASTHEVNNSTPLMLKKQVGLPNGDNCGGTYLNDRYAERLSFRLRDEHYLDCNGQTREKIVNGFIPAFETSYKRRKDVMDRPKLRLRIPGLRGDQGD